MRHTNTWMLFYAWGPAPTITSEGKEEGLENRQRAEKDAGVGRSEKPGEVLPRERWRKVIGHAVFPQTSVCELSTVPVALYECSSSPVQEKSQQVSLN